MLVTYDSVVSLRGNSDKILGGTGKKHREIIDQRCLLYGYLPFMESGLRSFRKRRGKER